jgi:hypothetical protein
MFEGVGSLCLSLCKLSMFTSDNEENKFGNKRDQAPIVPPLAEFPTQIQSTAACYFRELLHPVTVALAVCCSHFLCRFQL